jgi:hypothetical protein
MTPYITSIALAVVAVASLAGAIFLTWNGDDATPAWASLTGAVGLLAGQQMEPPTGGTSK